MRTQAWLVLVLVWSLSVDSVHAQGSPPPVSSASQAVLTPGDTVRITVWQRPDFSGDFLVGPDGSITHPLYRAVKVGGVPFATAEANLRTFLVGFLKEPQFSIEPLIRVSVSGEVTRPQVFAVRPEAPITEAVARAGGLTQMGARDRVRVLRLGVGGQQQQVSVNLGDPGAMGAMFPIRSGDQIIIDRKRSFFRDILIPALSIAGSVASIGLLIDRSNR